MNRLQIFNAVVLAAGAAMGLVMSVVCLIYLFYLPSVPRLRAEFDGLLVLSGGFWAIAATSAVVFVAHRRQARWRWLAQPLPLLPMAGIGLYLWMGA